jgi:ferredoxin
MTMRVSVDPDVCEGTGYCARVLPDVFALTDDGRAVALVERVAEAQLEELEEAERLCPVGAVILQPEAGA